MGDRRDSPARPLLRLLREEEGGGEEEGDAPWADEDEDEDEEEVVALEFLGEECSFVRGLKVQPCVSFRSRPCSRYRRCWLTCSKVGLRRSPREAVKGLGLVVCLEMVKGRRRMRKTLIIRYRIVPVGELRGLSKNL